jgi:hypothetical protein
MNISREQILAWANDAAKAHGVETMSFHPVLETFASLAYEAGVAEQPAPVQEPAGEAKHMNGVSAAHTQAIFLKSEVPVGTLLYTTPPAAPVQPDAWQALRDKVQADIDRPEGRWGMHGRRPKDAVDDDYFAALIWMVGQMDAILIHAAPEKGQP